jgi:hypothetical protein
MLPLNDAQPNRYTFFPFMTVSLIAVNTVILIWELSLPENSLNIVFYLFGFTPSMI